jgi:hypothetical protein
MFDFGIGKQGSSMIYAGFLLPIFGGKQTGSKLRNGNDHTFTRCFPRREAGKQHKSCRFKNGHTFRLSVPVAIPE